MPDKLRFLMLRLGVVVAVSGSFFALGCRALPFRPLRPPEELSRREVIEGVAARQHFFSSVYDTRISLRVVEEAAGGRERHPLVRGILIFDRTVPGLRLRAERFGRNIFSLRALGESFWLEIPENREVVTGGEAAHARMPHLVWPAEIALWFAPPDWLGLTWDGTTMETTRADYVFEVTLEGFPLRRVSVDRRDLHITSITTYDVFGDVDTCVVLDRYGEVNGAVFPHRLGVSRPRPGFHITLQFSSPQFDRRFSESDFQPPARPGYRHIDLDRQP